jgi:tetraacyldisaccharide 4'-kinase
VYNASDSARLLGEASRQGATLVTTAKDFVKLPAALRAATLVVSVRLRWENEAALEQLLA